MHCLLVTEPGVDGVFRHVEALAQFLMHHGVRVDLAYSSIRGSDRLKSLVTDITKNGGRTLNLEVANAPSGRDFPALLKLRRFVAETKPEVIHGHSSKAGALVRALVWLGEPRPVFYTPHAYYGLAGKPGIKSAFYNAIETLLGRTGTTITLSMGEKNFARHVLKLPEKRLRLIANPVDTQRFQPAKANIRDRLRSELGVPEGALLLGSVGRLAYQKDPLTLYRAFALACQRHGNLWLYHLGEGELDAECAALAEKLGIRDRILRQGYLSQPERFYQALDGMILTSRYEGLSFAVLEALATDLPVILSQVPGNLDFVEMGLSHCWSAQKEDAPGFAEAITAWLQDHTAQRVRNHRQTAETRFSQEACFGAILREHETAAALMRRTG